MSSGYFLTKRAQAQIKEILRYTKEEWGLAQAEKLHARFVATFELLAIMPRIGRVKKYLTSEPFRFWPMYPFLVIYLPDTEPLEIVRIYHSARDIKKFVE